MKMLWEKLDKFGIVVQTIGSSFQFPCCWDTFLMLALMDRGNSKEALIWLNWVQIHLQINFLSDILSASGVRIDPTVFQHRHPGMNYSTKKWPKEEPTESEFELWKEALEDICPSRLGWEFQYLIPISGTPIGSRIPILFQILDIPVGIFLRIPLLKTHQIGIPICKIQNSIIFLT